MATKEEKEKIIADHEAKKAKDATAAAKAGIITYPNDAQKKMVEGFKITLTTPKFKAGSGKYDLRTISKDQLEALAKDELYPSISMM